MPDASVQQHRSGSAADPDGRQLMQAGIVTRCQLQCALAFQRAWNGRLGLEEALVKLGFIPKRRAIIREAADQGAAV